MAIAPGTRLGAYEVAIKTLPSALAQDHDRLARFDRDWLAGSQIGFDGGGGQP